MTSSMGFKIEVNDIQEGATLDKVLGAGFKKINIFNSREGVFFPLGDLKGDMKRKSANYMYENFEILETENEEEQPSQSRSSFRKQCSRNGERPLSSNKKNLFIESEISDKINKKYKNKLLTVSHQLSKLIGNINSFDDVQDKEEIVHTSETNSRDSGIKGNEDSTTLASRKFSVKRKNKGSNSQTSRKIKVYAGLSETFRDSNVDKERITKDNFNNQQKMAEHQGQHEDSKQFRASMKNFRKTMYTDRHKNGSVGDLSEKYDESRKTNLQGEAKSKLRASVANWNPLNGYTKVIERNNDIRYIFGTKTPQMRSTEINFHGEKPGQKKHSKHFSFTNNLITERIMQHEQELLDKYSHKKLLNQTERNFYRGLIYESYFEFRIPSSVNFNESLVLQRQE